MIDLEKWLNTMNPAAVRKWTLSFAYGINDSGLITGKGWYDDGPGGLSDGNRAYILDIRGLVSVPEPPSCMLLLIAASGFGPRRRQSV